MSELEREYSLEEFFAVELPDETEYELWQGKIVTHPYINFTGEHGEITAKLAIVRNFLDTNPIGRAYTRASCQFKDAAGKDCWVIPDFSFVAKGRTPEKFRSPNYLSKNRGWQIVFFMLQ